ncbi:unnamed protein product [Durusdinium trenchii]|uniref:Uncharacterized protein n=1 Tax=Durusdinium trenchii TaxID=1381693 RepID=A0ABP0PRM9_9DINO
MGSGSSAHAKQNSRNQGSRSSQSSKKSHQMMGVVPYAGCGGASALSRFSVTCPTNRFFVAVGGLLVKQDQTRTSKGSKASARSRSASRPPNSATRSDAAMLARKSTMSRKSMKSVTFGADEVEEFVMDGPEIPSETETDFSGLGEANDQLPYPSHPCCPDETST